MEILSTDMLSQIIMYVPGSALRYMAFYWEFLYRVFVSDKP